VEHAFEDVIRAESECMAANIDENDHTVFSCQDLQFELELLVQAIVKRTSFLDNQVCLLALSLL
jgi:protein-arginine kinase